MADDAIATTAPIDAPAPTAFAESSSAAPETNGESAITKEDEEITGKQVSTEATAPDVETAEVTAGPSATDADADVNATPASGKKEKRKSISGVPEHKAKKLAKKKSMPNLRLDCQPGEYYWARLKGYPPWPSIICDEQMLPESLLGSRPVSTNQADGTLRADFQEGGKNAKERTYPVMFLHTNEFSWMVNTSLTPLDPEECTVQPKTKITKDLQAAYKLGAENHDMQFFKDMLKQWQDEEKAMAEMQRQADAEAAEKAAASAANDEVDGEKKDKKKKASRKSKAVDGDIEMGDAPATLKSSKKRKKDAESDVEGGSKPKKTPKVTKLNLSKTPNGGASTKKSKQKVEKPSEEAEEKPQMSEEERMRMREKTVLYLRHRLQKGFLTRDQAPQESEMDAMAEFFVQLEGYKDLESSILKLTKIHKVLKGIVKLSSIPKDDVHHFKKRSGDMLEIWNMRMETDADAPISAAEPKSNAADEEKAPDMNGEAKVEPVAESKVDGETQEGAEKEVEIEAKAVEAADEIAAKTNEEATEEIKPVEPSSEADHEGDVSMQTAPEVAADAA